MADDEPRKPTTRRDHILSFISSRQRPAALRVFDMLDKSAPPPPPPANKPDPQREK